MYSSENIEIFNEEEDIEFDDVIMSEEIDIDDEECLDEMFEVDEYGNIMNEGIKDKVHKSYSHTAIIKSAKDIDETNTANVKKWNKFVKSVQPKLQSGELRHFQSGDKALLSAKLKNKEFWNSLLGGVIATNVKYSVFKYKGFTIFNAYTKTNTTGTTVVGSRDIIRNRGMQRMYALFVKPTEKGDKLVLKGLTLAGKKETIDDRIDYK